MSSKEEQTIERLKLQIEKQEKINANLKVKLDQGNEKLSKVQSALSQAELKLLMKKVEEKGLSMDELFKLAENREEQQE